MKSKYAGQCKRCEKHWNVDDEVFMSKSSDGTTWIICPDKQCFESQGGKIEDRKKFVSNKFPISEATKIYDLTESILESFLKRRNGEKLAIEQQAVFIESIFKTLSGSFKQ